MRRAQKMALLSKLIQGKVSQEEAKKLKQQTEVWTFVVCDNREPALTDLVDTRLSDQAGRSRVSYGEFLENPLLYGQHCITVDKPYETNR